MRTDTPLIHYTRINPAGFVLKEHIRIYGDGEVLASTSNHHGPEKLISTCNIGDGLAHYYAFKLAESGFFDLNAIYKNAEKKGCTIEELTVDFKDHHKKVRFENDRAKYEIEVIIEKIINSAKDFRT